MCGIAGIWAASPLQEPLRLVAERMTRAIAHRGPDGSGTWCDEAAGLALGHRRLSIIDLSELGRQPMHSGTGRFTLTFNGEIYNFEALRTELRQCGHHFQGRSDTEVLLAAFEQWGIRAATERAIGMFAFAAWDSRERELTLGRDRLGKKPMYYGQIGRAFAFASELKALRQVPGFAPDIDRNALSLYIRHNYVPAPYCIYSGLHKLEAGSLLRISQQDMGFVLSRVERYWSPADAHQRAMMDPFCGTLSEAEDELEKLLTDAVRLRMISDVPLGAFLSGGIDSSLITALMQKQSARAVRTFTIGFRESSYDEARHARAVATHLGTDHTEIYLEPRDALAVIPSLPSVYDEPFADSSQIPTMLVCSSARRYVTVALSGDGGDESFAGYNRYFWLRRLWRARQRVPSVLRPMVSRTMHAMPADTLDRVFAWSSRALPERWHIQSFGHRVHRVADLLALEHPSALYRYLISQWQEPGELVVGADEQPPGEHPDNARDLDAFTLEMMRQDLDAYLPDDILVKVDRASMAVALEVRAPLLDHRVVELAARLPLDYRMDSERGKVVLRRILDRYVPRSLTERPKTGFGVPIDTWLRGPLREWACDLLDPQRMRDEGYLLPEPITRRWQEHVDGSRQWHYPIWVILMFQAWLRENGSAVTATREPVPRIRTA